MRRKITKRTVDEALPTAAKYMVRDTELKGFVLIVYPNGVKSYALDYRAGWGRGAPSPLTPLHRPPK